MKRLLASTFILISIQVLSQSWSDAGANWKYSYSSGFGVEGYVEINYVGDTLISTQLSQKLSKNLHGYDFLLDLPVDYFIGMDYTYENNGVVFVRHNENWDTLYDFNASIGESWRMAKQPLTDACDSNSTLTVIDAGTKTINSTSLNYIVVEFIYGGTMPSGITDTIIEKIGFTGSYMFPYDQCDLTLDANQGGPFRCYSDNLFPSYKPHYSNSCTYVSIDEISETTILEIFPNPASASIQIRGDFSLNHATFEINNISGQKQLSGNLGGSIDISNLPQGFYVLSILSDNGIQNLRFVKE